MLRLECITHDNEFLLLEDIWNTILERSGFRINRVFFTFSWAHSWWKYYSSKGWQLHILLIKDEKRPIALIPLVKSEPDKVHRIQILGCESLDYQDFMIAEQREECFNIVLNYLSHTLCKWDMFTINRIPANSPNIPFLKKLSKSKGRWTRLEEFEKAPLIKIDTDWNLFYNTISKKIRSDTHRQIKRLNKLGRLHFFYCDNKKGIPDLMSNMIEYKDRRYVDTGKNQVFTDEKRRFYIDLAERLFEQGSLDLSYLHIDGDIIAIHFGFIDDKKFYYLMPTFNPKYKKYSPGRILLFNLLQRSFEQGLTEFDFGFGEEPYKGEWAQQDRILYRFLYFNQNLKGLLLREWFQTFRGFVRETRMLNSMSRKVEKLIAPSVSKS